MWILYLLIVFLFGVTSCERCLFLLFLRDGISLTWPLESEKLGQDVLQGNFLSRKMTHRQEKMAPFPTYHGQVKTCSLGDWQEKRKRKKTRKYLLRVGQSCALELQSGHALGDGLHRRCHVALCSLWPAVAREPFHCFPDYEYFLL